MLVHGEQAIEVYRQPSTSHYQVSQKTRRRDEIQLSAFPELSITVDEILG